MFGVTTTSDDYEPVTYVGRYPVDVTMLLVAAHAVTMIAGTLLIAAGHGWLVTAMMFDSARVLGGELWQVVTYAFVHQPSIWFVIHLFFLFFFGREVERFIGRRAYVILYAALLLLPPLLLTAWGLAGRITYADSDALHFGIFVAFAAIYPGVELIFRIQAKWMALVFGVIAVLQYLAANAWPQLTALLLSIAFAFFFIRMRGAGPEMEWLGGLREKLQPKPKFKVVPKPAVRRVVEPEDVHVSIDPLLEKISKHGINSLTASERRALDRARNQLLNKSK